MSKPITTEARSPSRGNIVSAPMAMVRSWNRFTVSESMSVCSTFTTVEPKAQPTGFASIRARMSISGFWLPGARPISAWSSRLGAGAPDDLDDDALVPGEEDVEHDAGDAHRGGPAKAGHGVFLMQERGAKTGCWTSTDM
ncbi:hypothetical protein [Polyangium sp. 15x6]|uniref:hypothetical protein n=1 Tax=Polyangium sp. 15x6 TaxID=3042687 RepID=UPI00249AF6C7|nr:hypothetical protein [Polyangium sp. 15x6]MDI3284063.1 hypothetical protein [Polyangium sp. 15x6]